MIKSNNAENYSDVLAYEVPKNMLKQEPYSKNHLDLTSPDSRAQWRKLVTSRRNDDKFPDNSYKGYYSIQGPVCLNPARLKKDTPRSSYQHQLALLGGPIVKTFTESLIYIVFIKPKK